jgi:hypothetical protein
MTSRKAKRSKAPVLRLEKGLGKGQGKQGRERTRTDEKNGESPAEGTRCGACGFMGKHDCGLGDDQRVL